MYAIIATGGKQYKVAKDDILEVEKLDGKKGDAVVFDKVLLAVEGDAVKIGRPYVAGAKVLAEKAQEIKAKRVISFKFRRRKNSKTRKGHRQNLSRVTIKEISA